MVLMYVKKSLRGPGVFYKEGDVYLVGEQGMETAKKALAAKGIRNALDFLEINDLFSPFLYGSDADMLIVRTGGIGDIIALSTVAAHFRETNIKFITADGMLPIFDWYETDNVTPKSIMQPLLRGFRPVYAHRIKKNTERFFAEGVIEEGDRANWYEVFFGLLGMNSAMSDYMRPRLKQHRINNKPSNINTERKSILIAHRASAQMRSMSFEDLYRPVARMVNGMDIDIYVHASILSPKDREYIAKQEDSRIQVIEVMEVGEYLLDLYDATLTISVDTAAIHFREGIRKPGIGIYSSFTADSRVKYYDVTHSFDITSECDLQPCFLHQQYKDHVCERAVKGDTEAPCLGTMCKSLHHQIVLNSGEYLLKALK